VRPELGHGNHGDLYSGGGASSSSRLASDLSFFAFGEFFGELSPPVSGESLRDPALRRLIRQLDAISLRLTPRERFVCE